MSEQANRVKEIASALKYCANTDCVKACPRYFKTSDGAKCARELMREAADLLDQLQRETEPVPLTCAGCRLDEARKMMPLTVNDSCQRCIRLPQRSDRYQPKGEATYPTGTIAGGFPEDDEESVIPARFLATEPKGEPRD